MKRWRDLSEYEKTMRFGRIAVSFLWLLFVGMVVFGIVLVVVM